MSTIKTKTFSSGKAAVSNARSLAAKGEISRSDLRRVEAQVKSGSSNPADRRNANTR